MHIGKVILKIRKKKNITQQQLADECGISKSYISMIERGNKKPTMQVLEDLSQGLDIPFPILSLLSLDVQAIDADKRALFEEIIPNFRALAEQVFIGSDDIRNNEKGK